MFTDETLELAKTVIAALFRNNKMIVTAESCTGGLIAGALTEIPGSSEVVHGGFVTYANAAKMHMLGVEQSMLDQYGAVSEQVAQAMAEGALKASGVAISIAVTGVAGPGGGTEKKPVGLVHFGCAMKNQTRHLEMRFGDIGRKEIRAATVETALKMVLETLISQP
jgi:nicotinamide-nucleotide amidase